MDVEWLHGQRCTSVSTHAEGQFAFHFTAAALGLSCAWRLVVRGQLVLAHTDHGQQFGRPAPVDACTEAMAILGGHAIRGGRIDTALGDIVLEVGDDIRLEVFNDSSGYEGWTLTGPAGTTLVAISGGEVCSYSDEA